MSANIAEVTQAVALKTLQPNRTYAAGKEKHPPSDGIPGGW